MLASLSRRAFALMAAVPIEGVFTEFGVFQGHGLLMMARNARRYLGMVPSIYGFDSFGGMPETVVPLAGCAQDWGPGTFNATSKERVAARLARRGIEATIVKAVFSDLPPLASYGINTVRFAHIDPDIYEGYRDALRLLTPHLRVGSVVLFDESWPPTDGRYELAARQHGKRAVDEWELATGTRLHVIRFEWSVALTVVVDDDYLTRHRAIIEHLRRDTIPEFARYQAGRMKRFVQALR